MPQKYKIPSNEFNINNTTFSDETSALTIKKSQKNRKFHIRKKQKKSHDLILGNNMGLLGNTSLHYLNTGNNGYEIINLSIVDKIKNILSYDENADLRCISGFYSTSLKHIEYLNSITKNNIENSLENTLENTLENNLKNSLENNLENSLENNLKNNLKNISECVISNYHASEFTSICTDFYNAIKCIFELKNSKNSKNDLDSFLNEYLSSDQNIQEFKYIRLKDVFKSKGNSINGPRREDVGRYNRKLFGMQTAASISDSVALNPKFFDEPNIVLNNKSEMIFFQHCEISYFDSHGRVNIGDYKILIYKMPDIHETPHEKICSILNTENILFDSLKISDFISFYDDKSTKILFLYLESFIIYEINFVNNNIAKTACKLFFDEGI